MKVSRTFLVVQMFCCSCKNIDVSRVYCKVMAFFINILAKSSGTTIIHPPTLHARVRAHTYTRTRAYALTLTLAHARTRSHTRTRASLRNNREWITKTYKRELPVCWLFKLWRWYWPFVRTPGSKKSGLRGIQRPALVFKSAHAQ